MKQGRLSQAAGQIAAAAVLWLTSDSSIAQLSLPDQIDLSRLVDLSAQRLNVRVSYDDQALKGKVTLRQASGLTDIELWRLTNRVLAEQGFTTVRSGDDNTIAVVKIGSAAQAARVEHLDAIAAERGATDPKPVVPGFRRVLVPLQRASAKDIVTAVQLVLSKPAGVATEAEQAGIVMIADLTPSLEAALKLVEQLDGAEGGASVRDFAARNIDATRLAALAKQLADKRKAVGGREIRGEIVPNAAATGVTVIAPPAFMETWESIITAADQREPAERRTYSAGAFGLREVANLIEQTIKAWGAGASASGSEDRWKIVFDDLTGSLIITATPAQHEQIGELLNRLASIPAAARRPVRTFVIKNRSVKDVQQVIEDLMRSGVLEAQANAESAGSASATGAAAGLQTNVRPFAAGGTEPTIPTPTSQSTSIAPSAASSVALPQVTSGASPLISSSRSSHRGTSGPLPAALTLTSDEATNTLIAVGEPRLLAQLEQLLPSLDVRQPQVMLETFLVSLTDNQSMDLGVELERLRIGTDTFIKLSSLFGLSTSSGSGHSQTRTVPESQGLNAVVLNPGDFSIIIKALETMNKGRSLSSPKILVANNQQATFNSVLQQPFSSTNASNTVSTTSFGGTQDAGTTVSVKPQIAQGDHLALTYSVALSSFVGAASNPNLPPPRQQNTVQSVATIPDGYTVVVGGLEVTSEGETVNQVPILGSIPLVGELFKDRSNARTRTRFFVFIRAGVLRDRSFEDLKYVSDHDVAAAKFPPDWPEVEPRVIR